ncbi:hypothetical protein FSP39_008556 [Pinctada imbricata]|uniref:Uncharacterized protein n=1 Tax=Pinctada imbricata TaxID=66713 RepID=A0AA88Y7S3_PINIB|nr:hypothetical protein FSP39_008556 [Pinctada imbricata]
MANEYTNMNNYGARHNPYGTPTNQQYPRYAYETAYGYLGYHGFHRQVVLEKKSKMLKSLRRTTDDDGRRRTTDAGRHAMTIAHFEPMAQGIQRPLAGVKERNLPIVSERAKIWGFGGTSGSVRGSAPPPDSATVYEPMTQKSISMCALVDFKVKKSGTEIGRMRRRLGMGTSTAWNKIWNERYHEMR